MTTTVAKLGLILFCEKDIETCINFSEYLIDKHVEFLLRYYLEGLSPTMQQRVHVMLLDIMTLYVSKKEKSNGVNKKAIYLTF